MKIPVRTQIKKIWQASTITVLWTFHLPLGDLSKFILQKVSDKVPSARQQIKLESDKMKAYELVIKMKKPSADHPFTYIYEKIVNRFGKDWEPTKINQYIEDRISKSKTPHSLATLFINEFLEACEELTQSWIPPFEAIEQKKTIIDKVVQTEEIKQSKIEEQLQWEQPTDNERDEFDYGTQTPLVADRKIDTSPFNINALIYSGAWDYVSDMTKQEQLIYWK